MEKWLDIVSAIFALFASSFWFLSAYGKLPIMQTYWDSTPDDDPFYKAVKYSAIMNKWAAAFSAVSALCVGIKLFVIQ